MLTSGDVVDLDLGLPVGHEAGLRRPSVVITAQRILDRNPSVLQIVPLTSTHRDEPTEVTIDGEDLSGLDHTSAAQCQHIRSVSAGRVLAVRGNIGPAHLSHVRELIALIIDAP